MLLNARNAAVNGDKMDTKALEERLTAVEKLLAELEDKHSQMVENHDLIDDHEMTFTEAIRKGLFEGTS